MNLNPCERIVVAGIVRAVLLRSPPAFAALLFQPLEDDPLRRCAERKVCGHSLLEFLRLMRNECMDVAEPDPQEPAEDVLRNGDQAQRVHMHCSVSFGSGDSK